MTASVVVAAILVAGTLVLPYSYAMARSHGSSNSLSLSIQKSVEAIHQKVVSVAKGGSANGGKGGESNGGNGGTSNGGGSGASTCGGGRFAKRGNTRGWRC